MRKPILNSNLRRFDGGTGLTKCGWFSLPFKNLSIQLKVKKKDFDLSTILGIMNASSNLQNIVSSLMLKKLVYIAMFGGTGLAKFRFSKCYVTFPFLKVK